MPELPEVETVRRGLMPVMEGERIAAIEMSPQKLRFAYPPDFRQVVQGAQVETLERRGKYMTAVLSNGASMIMHLGMSGAFRIVPAGGAFVSQRHDHLIFTMAQGSRIIYNDPRRFGFFDLVHGDPAQEYKPFRVMGPEPLSGDFHAERLYASLQASRAPIKQALLDQSIVAGLGNIYVCEALYRSRIHPKRKACAISFKRIVPLVRHIKDVLEEAIASGGSSLRDHKGVDGTMGYFQHRFDVYGREGEVCRDPSCMARGEPCIKRITQAGRSTFYCSHTQR